MCCIQNISTYICNILYTYIIAIEHCYMHVESNYILFAVFCHYFVVRLGAPYAKSLVENRLNIYINTYIYYMRREFFHIHIIHIDTD